jgi:hypothetical protein
MVPITAAMEPTMMARATIIPLSRSLAHQPSLAGSPRAAALLASRPAPERGEPLVRVRGEASLPVVEARLHGAADSMIVMREAWQRVDLIWNAIITEQRLLPTPQCHLEEHVYG